MEHRSFRTERPRGSLPRWRKHLARPEASIRIARVAGSEAGGFELVRRREGRS